MGVFAEWQPRYAQHGIPTFPVKADEKKPAIHGYSKIGLGGSAQLAFKFPFADALAFLAGPKSGITVIDVDTSDEAVWRDTIKRFGETRIMVRTGSGNLQLWYRHNGEPRKIRAEGCIDVLGAGQVLAFPSKRGQGYTPLREGLEALHSLPVARNLGTTPEPRGGLIRQGGRHVAMLNHLRTQYRYCDDVEQLTDVALTFAEKRFDNSGQVYSEAEIRADAESVFEWCRGLEAEGKLFVGSGRRLVMSCDAIDRVLPLGADAVALYVQLQRWSNDRSDLFVANDMRLAMADGSWNLVRFRRARAALIEAGIITETRKASTYHGPAKYAWGQG